MESTFSKVLNGWVAEVTALGPLSLLQSASGVANVKAFMKGRRERRGPALC